MFLNTNIPRTLSRVVFFYSLFLALANPLVGHAHVGSAGVLVQKQVGKYQLLISITPPDVVPGTARVTVFVQQGRATSVGARPIYFRSGDRGAPIHDELTTNGAGRFTGDLWLMETGSSSIELSLAGPDGRQTVVVPVMAVATALRDMPPGTGAGLLAMGLLLVVMLVTIIGASSADGVTPPQAGPVAGLTRRRWRGMAVGLVFIGLALAGWRSWWVGTAEQYRSQRLYRPIQIQTDVAGNRQLTIQLDTTTVGTGTGRRRRNYTVLSYFVPDHGKLMHAFLVRTPGLDAFAHLHPARQDTSRFGAALPPLPAGRYLLFADVVFRSGYAETLTDTIDLPAPTEARGLAGSSGSKSDGPAKPISAPDRDDSWLTTKPLGRGVGSASLPRLDADMAVCGKPGDSFTLTDGSVMLWMDKPPTLEAGTPCTLKFAVADAGGRATPLEPYLGMSGHAAVLRSDGSVYIHLHPVGTYSMAAEGSLLTRMADTSRTPTYPNVRQFRDSIDRYVSALNALPEAERNRRLTVDMPNMGHVMKTNNMAQFPYAFPRAGQYRIFVQVRRNGQILTGVFDATVTD
jgi:hypothetical protein